MGFLEWWRARRSNGPEPDTWPSGAGGQVVRGVFARLSVDAKWSSRQPDGFTWWSHQQAQRVWTTPPLDAGGMRVARVIATTEVATGLVDGDRLHSLLRVLNRRASFSALGQRPDGRIVLAASMIAHEQNLEWVRGLFSLAVALQPIEAARASQTLETAGLRPARSSHPSSGFRRTPDEMFEGILAAVAGAEHPDYASGAAESLEQLAAQLKSLGALTVNSSTGLSAELPFGAQTSLLQVRCGEEHPTYGPGTLMLLSVRVNGECPVAGVANPRTAADSLNYLAAAPVLDETAVHELGGWTAEPEQGTCTRAVFLPALSADPGIVVNLGMAVAAKALQLGSRGGGEAGVDKKWPQR